LRGPAPVNAKKDKKMLKKRGFDQVPKFSESRGGGMVSSLAMTPIQGISLINPDFQKFQKLDPN